MIRVLLAVALTVALVAAATPAVTDARRTATERALAADLARVADAARTLSRREPAVDGPGARRVLTVHVPERSWWRASVECVGVRPETAGAGGTTAAFVYAVDERRLRTVELPAGVRPADGLGLARPGDHRLVLRRTRVDGTAVVTVAPLGPGGLYRNGRRGGACERS